MNTIIKPARDYRALRKSRRAAMLRSIVASITTLVDHTGEVLCFLLLVASFVMLYIAATA